MNTPPDATWHGPMPVAEITTVYALFDGWYEDRQLRGVFSTRVLAEAAMQAVIENEKQTSSRLEIEEHTLDELGKWHG